MFDPAANSAGRLRTACQTIGLRTALASLPHPVTRVLQQAVSPREPARTEAIALGEIATRHSLKIWIGNAVETVKLEGLSDPYFPGTPPLTVFLEEAAISMRDFKGALGQWIEKSIATAFAEQGILYKVAGAVSVTGRLITLPLTAGGQSGRVVETLIRILYLIPGKEPHQIDDLITRLLEPPGETPEAPADGETAFGNQRILLHNFSEAQSWLWEHNLGGLFNEALGNVLARHPHPVTDVSFTDHGRFKPIEQPTHFIVPIFVRDAHSPCIYFPLSLRFPRIPPPEDLAVIHLSPAERASDEGERVIPCEGFRPLIPLLERARVSLPDVLVCLMSFAHSKRPILAGFKLDQRRPAFIADTMIAVPLNVYFSVPPFVQDEVMILALPPLTLQLMDGNEGPRLRTPRIAPAEVGRQLYRDHPEVFPSADSEGEGPPARAVRAFHRGPSERTISVQNADLFLALDFTEAAIHRLLTEWADAETVRIQLQPREVIVESADGSVKSIPVAMRDLPRS